MKYLYPTDGSEHARAAEAAMERMLDPESDRLIILTVIDESPHPLLKPEKKAEYETEIIEQAEDMVDEAAGRLREKGIEVETDVHHGNPGSVICAVAENEAVDGIIMGRRGRGTATEMLLGSVSRYVIHHAGCPVTVVPPEET